MKNKQYRQRKQLIQLRELKSQGKKSVLWKLSEEQIDFLGKHFIIEPYLYSIKTKKFIRVKQLKDSILKDIHYSYKRGKKELVRPLKEEERRALDKHAVYYRPCKFIIYLNK